MIKEDFISASIVTYNDWQEAENACRSIIENTLRYPLKLYVFDNGSIDGTADRLSDIPGVEVVKIGKNIGFGAAHNKILDYEMGKIHFVINPDIIINSDVISDMCDFLLCEEDIAMAMPKILNEDGTEQYLPKESPTFKRLYLGRLFKKIRSDFVWQEKNITDVTDINFCSGCFFAVKSDVFKELNGFDERYFMYLEDADLTIRVKKNHRVVFAPQFSVTHLWHRESAKNIKYLLIHIWSSLKFLFKWRKDK